MSDDLATKRPRGRPTQPESHLRTGSLNIRLRPDLREKLERGAAKDGRSLSAEIERLLLQALADSDKDRALERELASAMVELGIMLRSVVGRVGMPDIEAQLDRVIERITGVTKTAA